MHLEDEQLYKVAEWRARTGLCARQVETMVADGRIPPPIRVGRVRRWSGRQIREWIERQVEAAEARGGGETPAERRPGRPRGSQ